MMHTVLSGYWLSTARGGMGSASFKIARNTPNNDKKQKTLPTGTAVTSVNKIQPTIFIMTIDTAIKFVLMIIRQARNLRSKGNNITEDMLEHCN